MTIQFSNNALSELASALSSGGTSLVLKTGDGTKFATGTSTNPQYVTLISADGATYEIVKATGRTTDTLTVTRAQESTSARDWASGTTVFAGLTKGIVETFPQLDNGGNAKGTNAVNLQSGRSNVANVASGGGAITIGYDPKATANDSVAMGTGAVASGTGASMAFGYAANASGNSALAMESYATAAGDYSIALGYNSDTTGNSAIAIGATSQALGAQNIAIGDNANSRIATAWTANTAYVTGDVVKSVTGTKLAICVANGTSHAVTEPTWGTTLYTPITDNTTSWELIHTAANSPVTEGIAIGYWAQAVDSMGIAIGSYTIGNDSGVAIGYNSKELSYGGGIAIGYQSYNNSYNGVAIGDYATVDGPSDGYAGLAIGVSATATGDDYSVAIGPESVNRLNHSWNISGANLIRKDNAESATWEHVYFTGTRTIYFSKEIDLKTTLDDASTITIPTGATFYPDEIGLIVTASDTVTVQPNVSYGVTGNTTSILASTPSTKTAVKGRDIFTFTAKDGVNSLTASVKAGATATTLKGRFYWVGILVEDE